MNRPARFTVADVRRAIKAAEASGPEWCVEIAPDGTIRIVRNGARRDDDELPSVERDKVFVF